MPRCLVILWVALARRLRAQPGYRQVRIKATVRQEIETGKHNEQQVAQSIGYYNDAAIQSSGPVGRSARRWRRPRSARTPLGIPRGGTTPRSIAFALPGRFHPRYPGDS